MRKLFNEFFYIPKHGKIREKVMLTRVVMTITIMVMCLAAMSITAYAYFSYNITSGSSTIKAASFYTDVTVQITAEDGTAVENSNITPITSDNKNFRVEGLEVGKWYKFTITKSARNTAQTGFIIVSADGCPVTYHTQQLGVDKNAPGEYTEEITFKLMITEATDVILESHWGTSSCYSNYKIDSVDDERYIILNEEIKMIVNGNDISESDENSDSQNGTETTDTTTTPTTDTTTGTEPSDTTSTNTESTETSEPAESTTEPSSTTSTEPTVTEPTVTEPAATESTETTETQPTGETTGATTTEANG